MNLFPLRQHLSKTVYTSWPWWVSTGLLIVHFQAKLWLIELSILAVFLGLCVLVFNKARLLSSALLLFIIGFLWGGYWGVDVLDKALPSLIIKQDIWVTGKIQDLPKQRQHALNFRFNIDTIESDQANARFDGTVILNWYDKPYPNLKIGQTWRLKVRLKPAHGSLNPGGFDYEQYLFSQGIRATGYVRETSQAQILLAPSARYKVDHFRAEFKQFIEAQSSNLSGILAALSVGDRSGISPAQWKVFRDTGTAHLIAISGLHIGLVAGMVYFMISWLWRNTLLLKTQHPTQHVAQFSALVAALMYAALAGFALPTLRAFLMLLAYFSLQWLKRTPPPMFTLGFVLMVVLLFDPLAPLGSGLWLSFGAVIAIMLSVSGRHKKQAENEFKQPTVREKIARYFIQWSHIQWAVFIALIPFSLLFFGQFSNISILANFIAIPVIGMLVVPLVLLALIVYSLGGLAFAEAILWLANNVLNLIWPFLQFLETLPFAAWLGFVHSAGSLIFALVGVIILLTRQFKQYSVLGLLGFMPLFWHSAPTLEKNEFEVDVLDVGQGLAIVVQTQNNTLLYDAGISYTSGYDSGSAIVLPFLRHKQISRLSSVVVSHNNIDHYGGVAAVVEHYSPQNIYSSAAFFKHSTPCEQGIHWQWDGVEFEFIHPGRHAQKSDNNDSCVLKVQSKYGSILLTGDIEKQAEKALLAKAPLLDVDVLLAPHHGSKTSSTAAFVDVVKPQLAIISAGYLNRFHHPHTAVTRRYKQRKIALFNTAESGWINIKFDQNGFQASPYRAIRKRYWSINDKQLRPPLRFQPK